MRPKRINGIGLHKARGYEWPIPFRNNSLQNKMFLVKVGQNTADPMTEEHWIEWIQLIADGEVYRKFLNPGDKPVAKFLIEANNVSARELCNIHGLWKS